MLKKQISKVKDDINKLQLEKSKLEAQLEAFNKLTEPQQLAIELHDRFCRSNHTDACGWYYEMSDGMDKWDGSTHVRYLNQAENLIHESAYLNTDPKNFLALYDCLDNVY